MLQGSEVWMYLLSVQVPTPASTQYYSNQQVQGLSGHSQWSTWGWLESLETSQGWHSVCGGPWHFDSMSSQRHPLTCLSIGKVTVLRHMRGSQSRRNFLIMIRVYPRGNIWEEIWHAHFLTGKQDEANEVGILVPCYYNWWNKKIDSKTPMEGILCSSL